MHPRTFHDLRNDHFREICEINEKKGADYASNADALANFKNAGEDLGLTPEQIWAVYAHKHWSAIMNYIKRGKVESEPIEGRIHDAILYLFLLLGLIEDAKPAPPDGQLHRVPLGTPIHKFPNVDPSL